MQRERMAGIIQLHCWDWIFGYGGPEDEPVGVVRPESVFPPGAHP